MAELTTSGTHVDETHSALNVLWFVSSPMPEASQLFELPEFPFGGWLVGSADAIGGRGTDLVIVHPSSGDSTETRRSSVATYVAVPARSFESAYAQFLNELRPDVVHVHGTEGKHNAAAVRVARAAGTPVVVSIQGLLSAYAEHFMAGIPSRVAYGFTLRDLARRTNPALLRRDFRGRGEVELATLALADRVIGRTEWDRAYVEQRVARLRYEHCDESLRPSFYSGEWSLSGCEPHSIFVSQGGYPLKGLHRVLNAMPAVLKKYPDARLYVAGPDPTHTKLRGGRWRLGSYGAYVRRLIRRLGLRGVVSFVGVLNEDEMRSSYMRANVFVLPSAIENSPNSLGEAMILGVPTISTFVGGVPSMVGEDSGVKFFQADAPYMLAAAVVGVFGDPVQAQERAQRARGRARARHDPQANADRLLEIYAEMADAGAT